MKPDFAVDTFEQARRMTRQHARTFYFASHVLPPGKRRASYALYSFCRYVDNIADTGTSVSAAREQLREVREFIDAMYDTQLDLPHWRAFQETVKRYQIPREYLLDLLEGVTMDVDGFTCRTFADLQRYCYHVASVVGLMMTRILQPGSEDALPYAEHLGTAMQLTNILRDIGEDFRMHRVYLPDAEMRTWGISADMFERQEVTPAFREFMRFQITRARDFYAGAEHGIALLPDDGSRYCVRTMSVVYRSILDAIEAHGYDVFTRRAHVPLLTKLRLATSVALHGDSRPYLPGRSKQQSRSPRFPGDNRRTAGTQITGRITIEGHQPHA